MPERLRGGKSQKKNAAPAQTNPERQLIHTNYHTCNLPKQPNTPRISSVRAIFSAGVFDEVAAICPPHKRPSSPQKTTKLTLNQLLLEKGWRPSPAGKDTYA